MAEITENTKKDFRSYSKFKRGAGHELSRCGSFSWIAKWCTAGF